MVEVQGFYHDTLEEAESTRNMIRKGAGRSNLEIHHNDKGYYCVNVYASKEDYIKDSIDAYENSYL